MTVRDGRRLLADLGPCRPYTPHAVLHGSFAAPAPLPAYDEREEPHEDPKSARYYAAHRAEILARKAEYRARRKAAAA